MFNKKIKTQPIIEQESPFMRKPSKEFLHKIVFNRQKHRQAEKGTLRSSQYVSQQNLTRISFIPTISVRNLHSVDSQQYKPKKSTIQIGTFKIKHENLLLKTEIQEIKQQNQQLIQINQKLTKENIDLKAELQINKNSRISAISQQTLAQTFDYKKLPSNLQLKTRESLEIESYEVLPSISKISEVNSIIFEQDQNDTDDYNFLSSSINRKFRPQIHNGKNKNQKNNSQNDQIQILSNQISYLQKQLQSCLLKLQALQSQNYSLRLCVSMSKRKIDMKECEIKEMKIKEKKKKYIEKLFQLSSQSQSENLKSQRIKNQNLSFH